MNKWIGIPEQKDKKTSNTNGAVNNADPCQAQNYVRRRSAQFSRDFNTQFHWSFWKSSHIDVGWKNAGVLPVAHFLFNSETQKYRLEVTGNLHTQYI